jgi:GNAT superfamily N-acetyltransferase
VSRPISSHTRHGQHLLCHDESSTDDGVAACVARGGREIQWRPDRQGSTFALVALETSWRGPFTNDEANRLHADAFNTRLCDAAQCDWQRLVHAHSLGWVTARSGTELVGFVNVVWDGSVHAWIQDLMVATPARRRGIGRELIRTAARAARDAGCEILHVDFEEHLRPFYFDACGFTPTTAGLMRL